MRTSRCAAGDGSDLACGFSTYSGQATRLAVLSSERQRDDFLNKLREWRHAIFDCYAGRRDGKDERPYRTGGGDGRTAGRLKWLKQVQRPYRTQLDRLYLSLIVVKDSSDDTGWTGANIVDEGNTSYGENESGHFCRAEPHCA